MKVRASVKKRTADSKIVRRKGRLCLLYTSPSPRDVEESRMT